MAPVTYSMNVHCAGCAEKIRKAIKKMSGVGFVDWVEVKFDLGRVIVTGNPDASALRAKLEAKFQTTVTILEGPGPSRVVESESESESESSSEEEEDDDDKEEDELESLAGPPPVQDPTMAFQAFQPFYGPY
ncbi:hypothetical protein ACP70R_019159 [Stipagrostis hirtigluma subsp. patula]